MKKMSFMALAISLLFSTSSFADVYEMSVDKIHCEKCVQKIHNYFTKNYKDRVQNLKVDDKEDTIKFDSISIDAAELATIQKALGDQGYKITNTKITKS